MSTLDHNFDELSSILSGFSKNKTGWIARCPAHKDTEPSLSIGRGSEGRILFNCHAGCTAEDILAAIGWSWQQVLPERERKAGPPEIIREYTYTDQHGAPLYQVVRFEAGAPHKYKPRFLDAAGRYRFGLPASGSTLYRLPDLLAAKKDSQPILIVEGERDAESVYALGLCATCNTGGANGWRSEFRDRFRGCDVYICGDNDAAGRSFVATVTRSVREVAHAVRIIRLPYTKKGEDVTDWIGAGGTLEALRDYMKAAHRITEKDLADLDKLRQQAVSMRRAGHDEPAIFAALDMLNHRQRVPAATDEVKKLAKQATERPAGERPLERKSELTIARYVLEQLGPRVIFDEGSFYKYQHARPGIWSEVPESVVAKQINALEGRLYVHSSDEGIEQYRPLAINASMTRGALVLAQYEAARPDFFAEAPHVVVCRNGALQVNPGSNRVEFTEHDDQHRARAALAIDYDEHAGCPRWLDFLSTVLPEHPEHARHAHEALQEFIGIALFGLATRFQQCLMLYGSGSNGKSTLQEIIAALFPPESIASVSPQSFTDDYHVAHLSGKLINICSEVPGIEITRSDRFKAVISGDLLVCREPYKKPYTTRLRVACCFAANELPGSRDCSFGFWRRFLPIPFSVEIDAQKKDPNIARKIIAAELPGLFAWAIAGARRALESGAYTSPECSEALKAEWMKSSDSVSAFCDDIIRRDSGGRAWIPDPAGIRAAKLYERYDEWCRTYHHKPVSVAKFGRRLSSLGVPKERGAGSTFYRVDADTLWSATETDRRLSGPDLKWN